MGTKYIPHVRVKRSYSRFSGSFNAAARFWAGEDIVQLGPSDFSPTSFTLGMRGRKAGVRVFFESMDPYLLSSSNVRNTSPSEAVSFLLSLLSAAIRSLFSVSSAHKAWALIRIYVEQWGAYSILSSSFLNDMIAAHSDSGIDIRIDEKKHLYSR